MPEKQAPKNNIYILNFVLPHIITFRHLWAGFPLRHRWRLPINEMKELFIVEGKSAASTVQQAMHKPSQSVLALQGKLINADKTSEAKILANVFCQKLFHALDCGIQADCQPDNLPFSRILILTDPDIDGIHARMLLLTLFEHYLSPLIDANLVSIILPPHFRIRDTQSSQTHYAWDEPQRMALIEPLTKPEITRFKGVAQFSAAECRKLLLEPKTRRQVNLA